MTISGGKPIRVAMVVGKMRAGGVESFLMNYYRHIDRNRVQFDFIIDSDSPNRELIPEIESLGGRVFEVPPYQELNKYLPDLEHLFRWQAWDVVHSQINTLSVFPLMAAKRAGVPVRIAHSHTALTEESITRDALKLVLRRFANVFPTHRMACGIEAGKWLFGPDAVFLVVPNAIELKRFQFNPEVRRRIRQQLGIKADELVLGHIGRFMKQKNHSFLIDVFAQIARFDETAHLVLAGAGPLEGEIKHKVAQLGLDSRVHFLGQRSDTECLYQAFDVFALPSLFEGFPVVAIEAQASNLPCLFSDSITQEAVLGDAVKTLPINSAEALWAESFWDLAGSTNRAKNIEAITNSFCIDNAAETLVSEYEAIVGETLNHR